VSQVLIENNADVNSRTSNLRTPLHIASIRGHLHIVKLLVINDANINAKDIYGNSPIHFCAEYGRNFQHLMILGHAETLSWLLEHSPVIHERNTYGKTPIDMAHNKEILQVNKTHYSK
jgi:ankyrin repeat protein